MTEQDQKFMRRAIELSAETSLIKKAGGVFGTVIVDKDGNILGLYRMADSTIFSRSLCHAEAICDSIDPNPGWPHRFSGGKYVPPKNGFRSGVSHTDIGQPPPPVVACTKVM